MRIVVWGINYAPEVTGIAPYNAGLCRYFAAQGHDVRMVTTFAYYPQWQKSAADRGRLYRTDHDEAGVPVHRCWHYVPARPSTMRRILHEFSFGVTSWLRLLSLPRADVYVVVSPPLILGPLASRASRRVPGPEAAKLVTLIIRPPAPPSVTSMGDGWGVLLFRV